MKLNREQITELFGSAPEVQGKSIIGFKVKHPEVGEVYFNSGSMAKWILCDYINVNFRYPVAIFEDTHRQDGTPLDIDPLPEVAGYRVEYKPDYKPSHGEDIMMFTESREWGLRRTVDLSSYMYNGYKHICLLHKVIEPIEHFDGVTHEIAKPTTLADLVGEDGQKNFYLIFNTGRFRQAHVDNEMDQLEICDGSLPFHANKGHRWSHSPFTKYEDAKEFVA